MHNFKLDEGKIRPTTYSVNCEWCNVHKHLLIINKNLCAHLELMCRRSCRQKKNIINVIASVKVDPDACVCMHRLVLYNFHYFCMRIYVWFVFVLSSIWFNSHTSTDTLLLVLRQRWMLMLITEKKIPFMYWMLSGRPAGHLSIAVSVNYSFPLYFYVIFHSLTKNRIL